ncbi:MAG: glycerol-3-phosphate 1-O-acyltransferase PlsY [Oscillospiraceae bacterium]|nr:glycerol-3-phosphate 1-O-acyltransferase PlsY [Oscillospiraceae bacterium]
MSYLISSIIGYLFGCINTAYIVGRLKGVNIKKTGTNNAGASNVFISIGKIYGVIVGFFDVFKAFFASLTAYLFFNENMEIAVFAGAMAVIGHMFPFWMKFNGGKGLAPFMGMVLFYNFGLFAVLGIILIAITLITDYISVAALVVSVLLPVYMVLFEHNNFIAAYLFMITVIMWYRHRENIKRLKNGTEIGFLRKNKIKK